MSKYGLLGKDIAYSFSKTFFTTKFELENRSDTYHNYDVEFVSLLENIIEENPTLKGLNVTIPYKETVIPLLDRVEKEAQQIGAVNTIKKMKNGKLMGYNTDHYGFAKALADYLPLNDKTALILGTGGASKAIRYVLETMGFDYKMVSMEKSDDTITYAELTREIMLSHCLIVNCTPIGTAPNTDECPDIPYSYITDNHLLFDLIYNPRETEFLKRGFAKGARVSNGLKMLEYQAKKSWKIWRS